MKYDASIDAVIAIRVQPQPSDPRIIYRVWTPSDIAYICIDIFIDGWMEKQHIHSQGDESYNFWRGALLYNKQRYTSWKF